MSKRIKVIHAKLGKKKANGLAFGEMQNGNWIPTGEIQIDERLKGKDHLCVTIHEILHNVHPNNSEAKINSEAKTISEVLWKLNYRRIQ